MACKAGNTFPYAPYCSGGTGLEQIRGLAAGVKQPIQAWILLNIALYIVLPSGFYSHNHIYPICPPPHRLVIYRTSTKVNVLRHAREERHRFCSDLIWLTTVSSLSK
jgi:hypothetical protein